MGQRKTKKPWLCRHNHPMIRDVGKNNWRCVECSNINMARNKEKDHCNRGHLRIKGTRCKVCDRYSRNPWLEELDANGEALCPADHLVSHRDDTLMYTMGPRGQRARCCRVCKELSSTKARSNFDYFRGDKLCRNKKHPKTEEWFYYDRKGVRQCRGCKEESFKRFREKRALENDMRKPLPARYVDWVVVERLVIPGAIGYLRRGQTTGPTDGEKWVAFCTWQAHHPNADPLDLMDQPGQEPMFLYRMHEWSKIGRKRKWRKLTLTQLRQELHTEAYAQNRILTAAA